jgi:hypothetical protein
MESVGGVYIQQKKSFGSGFSETDLDSSGNDIRA